MSATGMCPHNNIGTYCPSCIRGREMSGPMGASCPDGYYNLFGLCVPNSGTLIKGAQSGAEAALATGATQSTSVQQAAQTAAANTLGQKIFDFYKGKPVVAWGITAAVVALVFYGGLNFLKKN